jgi:hypothetical protein
VNPFWGLFNIGNKPAFLGAETEMKKGERKFVILEQTSTNRMSDEKTQFVRGKTIVVTRLMERFGGLSISGLDDVSYLSM